MAELFDSEYWSGQGPIFLAERNSDGTHNGLTFIGDGPSLGIETNVNRVDVKENVTGQRNTGASFIGETSRPVSITIQSAKAAHLAQMLQADLTVKTAGSVTDEVVTAHHDKFSTLAHVKVSTVVIQDETDTTTYVAGTDYVLHADEGMIEVLSTGSIGDGDTLHIDYAYAAQKHLKINPQDKEFTLVCPAINRARDSKRGRLVIHKLNLDPGSLPTIQDGDEVARVTVSGLLLLDTLRSAGDQLYSFELED